MKIRGKRKSYPTEQLYAQSYRKTNTHRKTPSEIFEEQTLNVKFTCVILLFLAVAMGIFGAVLFRNMEDSVIEENRNQMYYTMERNEQEVQARIDSAAMSTQFFLSDEKLQDLLYRYKQGKKLSAQEWVGLKNGEIAGLERLVNNNPLLYGVRVYALADNITEIMPILYRQDRMKQQPWAKDERKSFWAFDYNDQIFTEQSTPNAQKLAGFITQVWYDGQQKKKPRPQEKPRQGKIGQERQQSR